MRNFLSCFILYRKFLLYSKRDCKVKKTKKNKGTDPAVKNKIVSCEKSQKNAAYASKS